MKLALALSLLSVSVTTLGVYWFYATTQRLIMSQMTGRLLDVGRTASFLFDDDAIDRIHRLKAATEQASIPITPKVLGLLPSEAVNGLSETEAKRLMATEDFQQLVQILRRISEASRDTMLPAQAAYPQPLMNEKENSVEILSYLQVGISEAPDHRIIRYLGSSVYERSGSWQGFPLGIIYGYCDVDCYTAPGGLKGKASIGDEFYTDAWGTWIWAEIPIFDSNNQVIAALELNYDATGAANELLYLKRLCFSIIAASFVLSVAVALVIARWLNRPIAQLQTAALRVRDRDFDVSIDLPRSDEFGLFAQVFNQMVSEIRSYAATLEAKNEALEVQVQQRTIELQEKADQLEATLHKLQRTQSRIIHSEKMLGLGQIVAGVAHEINNPAGFISGNLDHAKTYLEDVVALLNLYQQHYPDPIDSIQAHQNSIDLEFLLDDFPKLLGSMQTGAERIKQIVLALRKFSRIDEAALKTVDLYEGIESTLVILRNRLNSSGGAIEIVKHYSELPPIECYAGELNQVFLNLFSNAIDAIEEKLRAGDRFDPTIIISTQVVDRHQIAIRISDNGIGMKESVRQQIFDPFFTTKPVGKGTGLGISIAHQIIVQKHGGTIDCTSIEGQGSEFAIALPVLQTQAVLAVA
ncbi:MAG: HAMP domain-containing protein [Leptolyngbyaceae cyanobacterium SM1_3_5]|nr:HAMP domain-containing protein [Leptolyngbyaceae cyanobacterium SM1_3_5]